LAIAALTKWIQCPRSFKEIQLVAEGQIWLIKPALAYMDVIWRVKEATNTSCCLQRIRGISMIKAAALNGWIDEERVVMETLTGFKRGWS